MKIVNISPTFPDCICGVGDYSYHLSKELTEKGHDVYVITSTKPEIRTEYTSIKVLKKINNWNILNIIEIIRTLKTIKPNIIYIQFVQYLYNRYGITLNLLFLLIINKIFLRRKIIIIFHEVYMKWEVHPLKVLLAIYQRLQAFFLLFFSDIGIVTSEKRMYHLKGLFPPVKKKIHSVPVGSNIMFKEFDHKVKEKLRINLTPNNSIILGTFGKLDYIDKDLKTLLYAVSKLYNDKKQKIFLLLVGGFKKENIVKKQEIEMLIDKLNIKNIVYFTGFLPPEETSKYLSLIDIFVSPILDGPTTRRTTLITAFAHSLPVIAFSGPENAEIFKNKENILLSKPEPQDLSEKIELLITDKNLRNALKSNALKLWIENFHWSKITNKILDLTFPLLSNHYHVPPKIWRSP